MNTYYVYFHKDTNVDRVVYVGKGKGDRAWKTAGRTENHKDFMESHYNTGHADFVSIVHAGLSNQEALQKEAEYIQMHSPMYNRTHTDEWLCRLRQQSLEQARLRCKKCVTPDGMFDSMKDVADFYNLSPATVSARFGTVKNGMYKLEGWDIVTV